MSKGTKNDKLKPDLSLIPLVALTHEALAFQVGERKYGRYNYTKGLKATQLIAGVQRHLLLWLSGEEFCPTDGQHHLGAARAGIAMLLHCQHLNTLIDDRNENDKALTSEEMSAWAQNLNIEKTESVSKKYELLKTNKLLPNGMPAYRVKRLSDGLLGGYVQGEHNLSQEGNCFVEDNAQVFAFAKVFGDAKVSENAQVYGSAWVCDSARVYGNAQVYDNARVYNDAQIFGKATVYGSAWVSQNAVVHDNAQVFEKAYVYDKAQVFGKALVFGRALVLGSVKVCGEAYVSGTISEGTYS